MTYLRESAHSGTVLSTRGLYPTSESWNETVVDEPVKLMLMCGSVSSIDVRLQPPGMGSVCVGGRGGGRGEGDKEGEGGGGGYLKPSSTSHLI